MLPQQQNETTTKTTNLHPQQQQQHPKNSNFIGLNPQSTTVNQSFQYYNPTVQPSPQDPPNSNSSPQHSVDGKMYR